MHRELSTPQKGMLIEQLLLSDSLRVTSFTQPSGGYVGGDLVEIATLPTGGIIVFVADAFGHGPPAAPVAAHIRSALFDHLKHEAGDLTRLMSAVNRSLCDACADSYATAAAVHVDLDDWHLQSVCAGHPAPLLAADSGLLRLESGGLPLGVRPSSTYYSAHAVLPDNGTIVIYTDGATDLPDHRLSSRIDQIEEFLVDNWQANCRQIVRRLRRNVWQICPDQLYDDLTLVAAKVCSC